MTMLRPRNWGEFQHYKDRSPPWIKLHRGLLDDFAFNSLPVEARALAPMLWLLASEHKHGLVDADAEKLAFRLRTTMEQIASAVQALVDGGLFEVVRGDGAPPLLRQQDACPESEAEPEEETETESADTGFEEFWRAYAPPKNARKPEARRAWEGTARIRPPQADLLKAVAGYRAWLAEQSRQQKRDYPMQHPATWLRGEVWNGFLEKAADSSAARAMWDGKAASLVDAIGAAQFSAWFAGSQFDQGPPARITGTGEFKRKWITEHFGAALARCYGDLEVVA